MLASSRTARRLYPRSMRPATLEHREEGEEQQDRREDDGHVAEASIETAERDLARLVLATQLCN